MKTNFGELQAKYSARGIPSYSLEMWHDGLKKHRVIKSDSPAIIEMKANLQANEWNSRFQELSAKQRLQNERSKSKQIVETKKAQALEETSAALAELEAIGKILQSTLEVDDTIDWESLKDTSAYPVPAPLLDPLPPEPMPPLIPTEPKITDEKYTVKIGFFDKLFASRRMQIEEKAKQAYMRDHDNWKHECANLISQFSKQKAEHSRITKETNSKNEKNLLEWHRGKDEYLINQREAHQQVESQKERYFQGDCDAIVEYCDLVLSRSVYPDYFPKEYELQYDQPSKTLIINYELPAPSAVPKLKSVKYVVSRDTFERQHISDTQASRMYDELVYQTCLRTIHEIFEADAVGGIDAVALNGIVNSIETTTGKPTTSCIVSIRAPKEKFSTIDLSKVDPKACFKALKGIGSAKLAGLSSVPPLIEMDKEDSRFVDAYAVSHSLDDSVNLADMPWEDFEHLIRELFQQEFSATGGDVKVTKASRDGGVDAIAFDPDPIRGGKIVIQAKRYTNLVGVSAVRDLYGTVLNEGATKGILVTTSNFGPDSYSFANGKPLVLLSGGNLLHMLERHGHKACIDLEAAKRNRKIGTD